VTIAVTQQTRVLIWAIQEEEWCHSTT